MDLNELIARQEIVDLITAYTRAVDTRRFADLAEVFTPDAVLDYTTVDGPRDTRDVVVAWIERGLAGFERFQHTIGQVATRITETDAAGPLRAEATAYFTNPMVGRNPDGTETTWELGGYYHHTLLRTPDGWRSVALREELVWTR